MTIKPPKLDPNDILLWRLLLRPIKRRTIISRFRAFLSHGSWQGIGGILGFLSLLISIFLTFYVYQLNIAQGMARLEVRNTDQSPDEVIEILNYGPAQAEDVIVDIFIKDGISRCNDNFVGRSITVRASQIHMDSASCIFTFDYIPSGKAVYISYINVTGYPPIMEIAGRNIDYKLVK